jgi:hypothetical protein
MRGEIHHFGTSDREKDMPNLSPDFDISAE